MDQELKTKTITHTGVETKTVGTSTQYKIKDENGKSYTFFDLKKDGTQTAAYKQFLDLKIGEKVGINYAEKPAVINGRNITYRNIMFFTEPETATYNGPQNNYPETSGEQSPKEMLKEVLVNTETIIDLLMTKVNKEVPVVHIDEDVNAELEMDKDDINADDLGF